MIRAQSGPISTVLNPVLIVMTSPADSNFKVYK